MTSTPESEIDALERIVDWTLLRAGKRLVIGAPLALGKPNALLNAFYRRAKSDSSVDIELVTALSLDLPAASSDLQQRFLGPFVERQFGSDYPRLDYVQDVAKGTLPANFRVVEFYFQSGSQLGNPTAQRHYISSNYTHVARDLMDRGLNVLVQMVAAGEVDGRQMLSLSCNPDITLNLEHRLTFNPSYKLLKIAHINPELPFMHGDALVERDFFDCIVEAPCRQRLFAVPRGVVTDQDYWVGINASGLVADGGTLQIGIGSLSDALVYALCLRHEDNECYRRLMTASGTPKPLIERLGALDPFTAGLCGVSEMFMDGFVHLHRAGILRREIIDDELLQRMADAGDLPERADATLIESLWDSGSLPCQLTPAALDHLQQLGILRSDLELTSEAVTTADGESISNDFVVAANRQRLAAVGLADRLTPGAVLEAAFFLGSGPFYQYLRDLDDHERPRFRMTSVRRVNQLYGGRETLEIAQRRHARFINTCMMMTVTGAAVSDAVADHQVVSGVGGQYNFVAMAHALHEGRSILMLRSTREGSDGTQTNIVWQYPHVTIPRHLRDLVVTEYGAAELRGRTDEECIEAMIGIADSRFQAELARQAIKAGKLRPDYEIPQAARNNTPARLTRSLDAYRDDSRFGLFPFGSDFTAVEERLVPALLRMKAASASRSTLLRGALRGNPAEFPDEMARMGLDRPTGLKERLYARLLAWALAQ